MRFFTAVIVCAVLLLNVFGTKGAAPGELVEYRLERAFPITELKTFFKAHHIPKLVLPANHGINIYEVIYTTRYADSSLVKASGLLYVPMLEDKKLPLMIYNHGTEICHDRSCTFTGEQSIGLAFAADGYVVLTPDYIGLGKGERKQLYLHAATEAQSSVDMLRASEKVLQQLGVKTTGNLFVTGYSQGGHAAMATTRLLQQEYAATYPVTASAPMSGPYDVEGTVYNGRNTSFEYPGFFFLLLQTYLETQGKGTQLGSLLVPPYDTLVPPLLDGSYSIGQIDLHLPDTILKTVKPEFYAEFEKNPDSDFRKFLRANNVFDWKPEMPMQLCYCDNDEEVPYQNSITTWRVMKQNGSKKVELWRSGKKFGHVNCALFSVVYTKMFFDGFRKGRPGSHGPHFKRLLINIGKLAVPSR